MTLSYTDTAGLPPSTAVSYTISAVNQFGEGLPSLPASATTLPATPLQPTVQAQTVNSSSIVLTWNNVGGSSYLIARNGTNVITVSGLTYTDTGLTASTTYGYTVTGINSTGQGTPGTVFGVTAANVSTAKFNPGHYMQPRSLDQSGPGAQNYLDIGLLATTNSQMVAASKPPFQGINFVYSWAYLEKAQGVYNFSQTVDLDVVHALATVPGCHVGIWLRSFGNQGTNAITQSGTSSNTAFSAANKGLLPPYLVQATSGGNKGWLQSTDQSMYTKSAPLSPNTGEYLWSMSQWGGSGYAYLVGGNWWHPVASQCFLNLKQALASHIVPDGQGFTYDNHPNIEILGSWDEESVNFGWGGTWSNRPPDDPGVKIGANASFTGGAAFASADGTSIASCTALQINAAIEQNLIGSKSAPPRAFTASDPGSTPTTWTVNAGFSHTSVSSCVSYLMSGNIIAPGNGFVTVAQLRQHMLKLAAGNVEFGNADLFGAEYSQSASGTPWSFGNSSITLSGALNASTTGVLGNGSAWNGNTGQYWTVLNGSGRAVNYTNGSGAISWAGPLTASSPVTGTAYITSIHPSNGILIGGVYADEAYQTAGAFIPPLAGVPSSAVATTHSPAITGKDFRGYEQINAYIEGLDYGSKMGAGAAAYTQAATVGVFRSAQWEWASRVFWQNCSNRFQPFPDEWNGTNPSFPAFILPAILTMPPFTTQQNTKVGGSPPPPPPPPSSSPLGVNLAGFNYSSGSLPFLNIMKQAGQQNGNYNWCGWITGNGAANGSTNEQQLVNFDSDQYPLKIPQAGLTSTSVYTILSNRSIAPGASTAYPAGAYRLKYTGSGTVVVSGGDVSSTLTLTNSTVGATVTGTVTLSGAGAITFLSITASNPANNGDYVKNISLVQSSLAASYDAGAIFHPLFLAATDPFISLRFMDWLQTNNELEGHNATGSTIAAGATSCTLASPMQIQNQTGKSLYFNDGTIRTATVTTTGGVTTLNWSAGGGALPNAITTTRGVVTRSNLYISYHDDWSKRPLPSNVFYSTYSGIPYEISIALGNAISANIHVNAPLAASDAYLTSFNQLFHSGVGAQTGGSLASSLSFTPELSNEVWNGQFTQYEVASFFGSGLWFSQPSGGGNYYWNANWYGYRCAVMAEISKTVWGTDFGRCLPTLGAQASGTFSVTDRLQTTYWTSPIDGYTGPASAHPIKSVACAFYFGQFALSDTDTTTLLGVPTPLNDFFATLTSQTGTAANGSHVYTSAGTSPGGWIGQARGWWNAYKTYLGSNYPTLSLIMYEGGQQFGGTANSAWNALMVVANRDARMGAAYTTYMNAWGSDIGTTFTNIMNLFNDCWAEQSNGFCWGFYESPMQNLTSSPPPKYAAAIAFIT